MEMEQYKSGLGPYGSSMEAIDQKPILYSATQPKICRLCLSETSNNCTLLEGVIRDMLEIILPELKLGICEAPTICNTCLETLKQTYNFKSSCLEAEDKVQGYINPKMPTLIDLKLVISANKMPLSISPLQNICRTCLNIVSNSSCTKLYSFEADPLKNMIDRCLPEMGIELTKEPVICPLCLEMLEEQFHFLMQCLDSEEKINYYCETKNCHSNIDLRLVYLFSMCMDEDSNDPMDSMQSTSQQSVSEISSIPKVSKARSTSKVGNNEDNISETISITTIGDVFEMTLASNNKLKPTENKPQEKRPLQGKLVPKSVNNPKKEESNIKLEETNKREEKEETRVKEEVKDDEDEEDEDSAEDFEDFSYRPNGPRQKGPKKCRHCDFKTKSSRHFKFHMTNKHPGKRMSRSDFKRNRSISTSESNTEAPENEIEKKFQCEKCPKKFETLRACRMHTTIMHTKVENKTKPNPNSDELSSPLTDPLNTELLNKISNFDSDVRNESIIGRIPPSNNILKRPLPFNNGNEMSFIKKLAVGNKTSPPKTSNAKTPPTMQYSMKQTYRFDRHMLTMFKCRLCPYQTRLKSNLTKHQQTHKKNNPSDIIKVHRCKVPKCSFETVQKESLLAHMKTHEAGPQEEIRKCFLCSFTTKKIEHLKKHVKEVHKAGSGMDL